VFGPSTERLEAVRLVGSCVICAVVVNLDDQLGSGDLYGHRGPARLGGTHDVPQNLSEDSDQVVRQLVADQGERSLVDASVYVDVEAIVVVKNGAHACGQCRPERVLLAELEDRGADLLDRLVQGVDILVESLHLIRARHPLDHGRQAHSDGEQLLDDVVVQIGGDPVVVLEQPKLLAVAPSPLQLQGHVCLRRKAGQLVAVGDAERGPAGDPAQGQGTPRRLVGRP
jgi:hypothetical protein